MQHPIPLELGYNISLLVALSSISGIITRKIGFTSKKSKIIQGLLFALISIISMSAPYTYQPGLIFDGRTILVNLSVYFFGLFAGIITAVPTIIYRIIIGGVGMIPGIVVILISLGTGYLFRRLILHKNNNSKLITIYIMGLIVHIGMVLCIFLLPKDIALKTFKTIVVPTIIIYPLGELLTGIFLSDTIELTQRLEEIKRSKLLSETTLDSIGEAIITVDTEGKITAMNPIACKMTGFTEEEAISKPIEKIVKIISKTEHREKEPPAKTAIKEKRIIKTETPSLLISREGQLIPIESNSAPIITEDKKILGAVQIMQDQSSRIEQLNKLRESEEKFRLAFYTSPDAIALNRVTDGLYIEINKGFTEITGYTPDDLRGKTSLEISIWENPEDREKLKQALKEKGMVHNMEFTFIMKDGSRKYGLISASIINISGEPFILSITRDITEWKKLQIQIEKSLEEKNILLRELHHRTKNNLQVIASLTHLLYLGVKTEEAQDALMQIEQKVKIMSMVHQKLFSQKDISYLDLDSYLDDVSDMLQTAMIPADKVIRINYTGEKIRVLMDTAIPIGLIVHELVLNSIKHAFKEKDKGKIEIRLQSDKKYMIHLTISDDGKGMPEDFDINTTESMGLLTVREMVKSQLGGELYYHVNHGTTWEILIKKESYKNRIKS
ncbi:PAS domain S-box protein [Spirochaetia bacterium 38H-sp]|uniref:PAS domain S-box protein n=1 Tax=Rarispira pelagica TaxID=3141764 RepID=A0ABU9UCA0_9SPIR